LKSVPDDGIVVVPGEFNAGAACEETSATRRSRKRKNRYAKEAIMTPGSISAAACRWHRPILGGLRCQM
jgi:hypothetical protein